MCVPVRSSTSVLMEEWRTGAVHSSESNVGRKNILFIPGGVRAFPSLVTQRGRERGENESKRGDRREKDPDIEAPMFMANYSNVRQ